MLSGAGCTKLWRPLSLWISSLNQNGNSHWNQWKKWYLKVNAENYFSPGWTTIPKVYRSTRYVFIHCLWLKIEFCVNLNPWIIDPAISNANLETLAKMDTFWYFSKILGDFLKFSVITQLEIVSVCHYGERDMSTFKYFLFWAGSIQIPRILTLKIDAKWIKTNLVDR